MAERTRERVAVAAGMTLIVLAAGWLAIEPSGHAGYRWLALAAVLGGSVLVGALMLTGGRRAAGGAGGGSEGYRLLVERLQEEVRELTARLATMTRERDESEHYIETLMDHVPANIYFKDMKSRFVRVNRSMANRLGCDHAADLIGKNDHDFFGSEHADQALEDERRIIATGQPIVGYVERETLPDGEEAWVLTTKMPFRDREGRMIGTFGISSEVSELVRAQQTLERERNILRALIDSLPDHISIKDTEGRYMVVNRAFAEFLGRDDPGSVLGCTAADFFPTEVVQELRADDEVILRTGEGVLNREEVRWSREDEQLVMMTTKLPLPDEAGEPYAIVALSRDVTRERRAQEALMRSERRLEDIIDNCPAVIYLKGADGRYELVNQRFERLFQVRREEVVGRTDYDICDRSTADAFRENDDLVIEEGEPIQVEEIAPHPDGDHTYVSVKFPLRDLSGEIYAIGGVSTDITDRKRQEEALRELNEELMAANERLRTAQEELIQAEKMESVGRLAAGVAHEVKNPLAMIGMGLEIVARRTGRDDEKLSETVERMRRGVERAKEIIRGLVDFSAARQLQLEACDLNQVVEETLSLLRFEAGKAQVSVEREMGRDLPPVLIDATKVEQVLLNLCINAVQAMEGTGGGRLRVQTRAGVLAGKEREGGVRSHGMLRDGVRYAAVDIEDTGPGIEENKMDKIFDPFFTTKATGKGTGLGLSVVRKIVDLHQGTIEIVNRAEGGVRATITFQAAEESGLREPGAAANSLKQRGERG